MQRPPWRDRLVRSVVDRDGFQPGRRQFERVALPSFFASPERHSRLGSNLSDQAQLEKLFAHLAENRAFHLVGSGQAKVVALRGGPQHHKLRVSKFDAHSPTLSLVPEARTIRAFTRTSPGSAKAEGAVGSRTHRATSDDDTNASFRTESQSFLTRARIRWKGGFVVASCDVARSTERSPACLPKCAIGVPRRNDDDAYNRFEQDGRSRCRGTRSGFRRISLGPSMPCRGVPIVETRVAE